jgi:hypothetical protein
MGIKDTITVIQMGKAEIAERSALDIFRVWGVSKIPYIQILSKSHSR